MKTIKLFLRYFTLVGIDLSKILALTKIGRFLGDLSKFKRLGGSVTSLYPILEDFSAPAGDTKSHYFHQDLLVARFVYLRNPIRHVDVASRIDGFVAHVASFRNIHVVDVRDNPSIEHETISFSTSDLMNADSIEEKVTDSISCLNAVEHFGLGRYGDKINPRGHLDGFNNLVRMVSLGGRLYISFPIGRRNATHFNAHRVFAPRDIFDWHLEDGMELELERFDYVDDLGQLNMDINLESNIVEVEYGCGIYTFKRIA